MGLAFTARSAERSIATLDAARLSTSHPPAAWLDHAPSGFHRLHAETRLRHGISLESAGRALRSWAVHRGAGFQVEADGDATVGATVVLVAHVGLAHLLVPCRVLDAVDESQRIGFTYASLPGHPLLGVERFLMESDCDGVRFSIDSVSRPAITAARMAPQTTRLVQRLASRRYLRAARAFS